MPNKIFFYIYCLLYIHLRDLSYLKNYANKNLNPFFILISVFIYGCVANKDTAVDRRFQNLTAKYNYIYNANVLLSEYNESLLQSYADNYEKILPVYLDPEPQINLVLTPGAANKQLDEVITKGQTIINDKSFSNYIDDAYMLLGKANYLKGNYFIASEYFDYTAKTYNSDLKMFIMAMNWKARSQMELNNMVLADKIIDTMLRASDQLKKDLAEPLATAAQMRIYQKRNKEAILFLESAIALPAEKQLRIRWRFILAQLQEKEKNIQNAYANFTKVEKSNAPFEMYFHANLNRIKLRALLSGVKLNKEEQLLALLKDDKNFDYTDQIYYQVGELFSAEGNFVKAEENYHKSVLKSARNQTQKALSYLRIADLNFKEFNNYIKAKLYYDSTVMILPKNFPDYDNIVKKADNLQYLTDRYTIIAKEDTAQAIAKLPAAEREAKVKAYLTPKVVVSNTSGVINNQFLNDPDFPNISLNTPNNSAGNTFYFNNNAAISNGFGDFKKRWGARQLEDNWRQSIRSSAQETNQVLAGGKVATDNIAPANGQTNTTATDQTSLEKLFLDALPTTPALLAASDQKIIDAYFEIASFYQQELNDKPEANKIYLELIRRYPDNNHLVAIYYSLYLNYRSIDEVKSDQYKQLVLTKFPESNFAKNILDPSYSAKQTQMENIIINNYNATFDAYAKKDYANVVKQADDNITAFPENDLAPQYAYLKAIAVGRTAKVDPLLTEFNLITSRYPNDKIITPLVRDHLKYIEANLDEFKQRPVALIDFDANAPRFVSQAATVAVPTKPLVVENPATKTTESTPIAKPVEVKPADPTKPVSIFSAAKSEEYYYVIDVADATLTLSSSRFGIGQFNRGNYPDNDLEHKLVELDNDQLIYITSFIDLEDAKLYESSITGQLKNIMKVPASLYKGFIISKENFGKLTDRTRINEYLEFLKDNYK